MTGFDLEDRSAVTAAFDEAVMGAEDFLKFFPLTKQKSKGDTPSEQYQTPTDAIRGGAEFITVGRDIYAADNPIQTVQKYQNEGWEAYLARIDKAKREGGSLPDFNVAAFVSGTWPINPPSRIDF